MLRRALCLGFTAWWLGCVGPDAGAGDDGRNDLPNDLHFDRGEDTTPYQLIADFFAARGLDVTPRMDQLVAAWPMNDEKTAVLNRFGTAIQLGELAYFHTALDVFRSSSAVGDEVLAPVSGTAVVFDWDGEPVKPPDDSATVVAIWDPGRIWCFS
jgi:hypothetical protein